MTYAIIETGGKQMRVQPGRFYDIELLAVEPQTTYTIDKVLLIHHEDTIAVGQPFVEGALVSGTVLEHRRGRKVLVYKMKPKKKTRKKRGHRQELTRLLIDTISLNGAVLMPTPASGAESDTIAAESVAAPDEVAAIAEPAVEPEVVAAVEETLTAESPAEAAVSELPVEEAPAAAEQGVEPPAEAETSEAPAAEVTEAESVEDPIAEISELEPASEPEISETPVSETPVEEAPEAVSEIEQASEPEVSETPLEEAIAQVTQVEQASEPAAELELGEAAPSAATAESEAVAAIAESDSSEASTIDASGGEGAIEPAPEGEMTVEAGEELPAPEIAATSEEMAPSQSEDSATPEEENG